MGGAGADAVRVEGYGLVFGEVGEREGLRALVVFGIDGSMGDCCCARCDSGAAHGKPGRMVGGEI